MKREMIFKKRIIQGIIAGSTRNPLVCERFRIKCGMTALVGMIIMLFSVQTLSAQTFSGGSGTQTDPYLISVPNDLVELSAYETSGEYFVLTNSIDMSNVANFIPIGTSSSFYGNFDGKGFSIKNLSIIDTVSTSPRVNALFGRVRGATISNVILDGASFSCNGTAAALVGSIANRDSSLYMDKCIVLNCTLKGSDVTGLVASTLGKINISNSHVINATMEGITAAKGFCGGVTNSNCHITNSSVRYSTITGSGSNSTVGGFVSLINYGAKISNSYVSNCVLSCRYIGGFVYTSGEGEVNNCGVQATLSQTHASGATAGFALMCGSTGATFLFSNSYAACEFKSVSNYDYIAAFGGVASNGIVTATNCYYKKDIILAGGNNSNAIDKSEADLKDAAMVAHPSTLDNSLNYGQTTPAWEQDFSPHSINKGYPILSWVQPFSYVSTYPVADLTKISATLQGLTFAEGESIITERGFQWREKGTGTWTTVIVTDTVFNILHPLAGLTQNTTYEYFAYMKTATVPIQHGDTVEFTTLGEYTISGKVTHNSSPLAGVTVSCTGYPSATTDVNGEYSIVVIANSTVTLTPTLSGYTFNPPSIPCSDVATDLPNQNFSATSVVNISEALQETGLRIYPNPTDGRLRITHNSGINPLVEVYDIVGVNVGAYNIRPTENEIVIDISHLSAGLYFLKIDNKTFKVVKQ